MFQGGLRTDLGALEQALYGNSGIGHFELFEQLSAEWLALLLSEICDFHEFQGGLVIQLKWVE